MDLNAGLALLGNAGEENKRKGEKTKYLFHKSTVKQTGKVW